MPTATAFTPRPYQREAEKACYDWWGKGLLRLMVVLPTGMGKTVILATMIAREIGDGKRVVIFVNRDKLVEQTIKQVRRAAPLASIGVVKSTKNQTDAQVIIASIQTLGRSHLRRSSLGSIGLVIIDECHHASANTYVASIRELGGYDRTRVVGFTATADRNDELGLGDVWQRVVYKKDLDYAWAHDYLIRPTIKRIRPSDDHPDTIAQVWIGESQNRQGMVFSPNVKRAIAIQQALLARGVAADIVHGEMSSADQNAAYARTERRETMVLVGVMVFTEGFDMPQLEVVLLDGGPGSQTTYVQKVGRVLRPYTDEATGYVKRTAIVIDCSGASEAHSLTVEPDLSKSVRRKRVKLGSKSATGYKITLKSVWFGRTRAIVSRETDANGSVPFARLYNRDRTLLIENARKRIREDQESRYWN
jgi:superfamily II DNA or RNA helicase